MGVFRVLIGLGGGAGRAERTASWPGHGLSSVGGRFHSIPAVSLVGVHIPGGDEGVKDLVLAVADGLWLFGNAIAGGASSRNRDHVIRHCLNSCSVAPVQRT